MVSSRPAELVAIDEDEARRLLAAAPVVRVAFATPHGPDVLPVNHVVHDGVVYFRTTAGSKLGTAAAGEPVALEADDADRERRLGWSVVAHGHATIVTDPALEERLLALEFDPWLDPSARPFWVRVALEHVTGRRIVRPGD